MCTRGSSSSPGPHLGEPSLLSHAINQSNVFRKSTPPENRQLAVLISNSKQSVHDFVEELNF